MYNVADLAKNFVGLIEKLRLLEPGESIEIGRDDDGDYYWNFYRQDGVDH